MQQHFRSRAQVYAQIDNQSTVTKKCIILDVIRQVVYFYLKIRSKHAAKAEKRTVGLGKMK